MNRAHNAESANSEQSRPTDEELDEVVGWAVFWFVGLFIVALLVGLWVS